MELIRVEQSHVDIIFEWANDPITRMYSFHNETILYARHVEWFQSKLEDSNCRFYICKQEDVLLGQIRVDFEEGIGSISYCVAPSHRGQGYGAAMLQMLEIELSNSKDIGEFIMLQGKVMYQNIASQKCFLKCDYARSEQDDYVLFTKLIR